MSEVEVTEVRIDAAATGSARTGQQTVAAIAYMAILAYPTEAEWSKRDIFVEAAKAALLKRQLKLNPTYRKVIQSRYRSAKNQQIDNVLNAAFRRIIRRRLEAGELALLMLVNACPNVRVAIGGRRVSITGYARWRLAHDEVNREPESARGHFFDRVWTETKPVLHLAMAWPTFPDGRLMRPMTALLKADWIEKAIPWAEVIRQMLPGIIPAYNPTEAVRLILS